MNHWLNNYIVAMQLRSPAVYPTPVHVLTALLLYNVPRNEISNGHIVTDPTGLGSCVPLADMYAHQHSKNTLIRRKFDLEADSEIERIVQTRLCGRFQVVGSPELKELYNKCANHYYAQYDNVVWGDTLTIADMSSSEVLAKSLSEYKYAPCLYLRPHKLLCQYFTNQTEKSVVDVTKALLTAYIVVMEQLIKNGFEGQVYPISGAPKKAQEQKYTQDIQQLKSLLQRLSHF